MNALVCDPRATLLPRYRYCYCCCYLLVASSIFILAANARAACYRNLLAQCGYCASVSSFSSSSCYCWCRLLCCRKLLQHLRAPLMNNVAFLDSHRMHRGKHHPETTLILWSIPAQNTISLGAVHTPFGVSPGWPQSLTEIRLLMRQMEHPLLEDEFYAGTEWKYLLKIEN